MVQLLKKRSQKYSSDDEKSTRLDRSDLKYLKDDKNEVSLVVINDIKNLVKEPCLNLLASSELVTWQELKDRIDKTKKAIELFEVKYRAQLSTVQLGTQPNIIKPAAQSNFSSVLPNYPAIGAVSQPALNQPVKPLGMPGVGAIPGIKTPIPATLPAKLTLPTNDDEEEDDDEDQPQSAAKPGAVVVKPAGMPGVLSSSAAMPAVKPAAPSLVKVPAPLAAKLPLAKPTASANPVKPASAAKPQKFAMPGLAGGMPGAR